MEDNRIYYLDVIIMTLNNGLAVMCIKLYKTLNLDSRRRNF